MSSFSLLRFRFLPSLSVSVFPHFLLSHPPIATASLHYQSHSQPHNHDDAVALFNDFNRMLLMRPPPPTFYFNSILSSLVKMQHFPTVISLFKLLESKGITYDIVTLNILINCFCHLSHITFAFSVLANILKRGYHPDAITLYTLIKGLCLRGEIKKALHFHDEVVVQWFQLNQVSYGMNDLCPTGETKAAVQFLRKLEGLSVKPDDVYTFNILVDALGKEGKMKETKIVLAVMMKACIKPDVVTYNSLMDGYFLADEVKHAKYVFYSMTQSGVTPNVRSYNIMIDGLSKKKMVDEAMSLFEEMRHKNMILDTITYTSLIDGICKSGIITYGRVTYVCKLLDEMHDRDVITYTYRSLMDALCRNRHLDQAVALFEKMITQGIQPDICIYTTLLDGLCRFGRLENAREFFQHLLVKGYHLNIQTYNVMINGLCKAGLVDEALALLSKMEDNGCIANDLTFDTIIYALSEKKDEGEKMRKLVAEYYMRKTRGILRSRHAKDISVLDAYRLMNTNNMFGVWL